MTTPPHKLVSQLWRRESITLQGGGAPRRVTATEAMALAERGLVEGVGPASGRVKYIRYLNANARPDTLIVHPQPTKTHEVFTSHSGAIAQTGYGVHREYLQRVTVGYVTRHGADGRLFEQREVIGELPSPNGYVYSFCMLRTQEHRHATGPQFPASNRKPDLDYYDQQV